MLLTSILIFLIAAVMCLGESVGFWAGSGKTPQHPANSVPKQMLQKRHQDFHNEFILPYTITILLTYTFGYSTGILTFVLILFFKFFGKLRENIRWVLMTTVAGIFINSGPVSLLLGLELCALILAAVAVRFFRERGGLQDDKKLLYVFLLNFLSFLILLFTLLNWSTISSINGNSFWDTTTRTLVLTYYLVKFGTILSAVLKMFFYESLPLQVLALLTLLQTIFVPLLAFAKLNLVLNPGSLVGSLVFIVANLPAMSRVMDSNNLALLLAYTTALTNGWLVLLLVL